MLWASGANYGLKKTLPHMLGITIGFGSLILLCGFGLGFIFERIPVFQTALKFIGALYLFYLAYRIATASFGGKKETQKPLSFFEAAGFQYANPKAWVMALSLMSTFVIPQTSFIMNVIIITLLVMLVNLPCISVWALFGTAIGRLLKNPRALTVFNFFMAALLVATVLVMLRHSSTAA